MVAGRGPSQPVVRKRGFSGIAPIEAQRNRCDPVRNIALGSLRKDFQILDTNQFPDHPFHAASPHDKNILPLQPGKIERSRRLGTPGGSCPAPKPFCGAKNSLTRQRIPRHLVQDWHHFCVALRHAPLFQPLPDVISTMTERTLSNRLHFSEPIVTVQTAFGHEIRVKHYALHS